MRRFLVGLVAAALVSGCAYRLSESRIDAIPEQYQALVTPSLVRAYFETSPGPHGWKYKDAVIDGTKVKATLLGPMDLEIGSVSALIADASEGRAVLVSLQTAENVYWPEDIDFIKSELYRFLIGGRSGPSKVKLH